MSLSLLTKLAMAGVVLTGVTGTAALGNVTGVNHEAKAEENPNLAYFQQNVDGHKLDFSDIFNQDTLTPKSLAEAIKDKLEKAGLNPENYKYKFKVVFSNGSSLGDEDITYKIVGNEHINTQTATFNPKKDKLAEFKIVNAQ